MFVLIKLTYNTLLHLTFKLRDRGDELLIVFSYFGVTIPFF